MISGKRRRTATRYRIIGVIVTIPSVTIRKMSARSEKRDSSTRERLPGIGLYLQVDEAADPVESERIEQQQRYDRREERRVFGDADVERRVDEEPTREGENGKDRKRAE